MYFSEYERLKKEAKQLNILKNMGYYKVSLC